MLRTLRHTARHMAMPFSMLFPPICSFLALTPSVHRKAGSGCPKRQEQHARGVGHSRSTSPAHACPTRALASNSQGLVVGGLPSPEVVDRERDVSNLGHVKRLHGGRRAGAVRSCKAA